MRRQTIALLIAAACDTGHGGTITDEHFRAAAAEDCMPGGPSDAQEYVEHVLAARELCYWAEPHAGPSGGKLCVPAAFDSMYVAEQAAVLRHGMTHWCHGSSYEGYDDTTAVGRYVRETQATRAEIRSWVGSGEQCTALVYRVQQAPSQMATDYGLSELGDLTDDVVPILELEIPQCL